ncbi:hypothetical protein BCR32DRAFT_270006 [Anaeromyces robustus]|uniref:G-protein coupled receptors family 1 profile domain-containing protein n=1 Tax=Anaeromyces robustus TaxID=1754192 RepID=A0A1Y1WZH4_9FUNG|nr:hypothetical protein BCR32DRAFT_270006 [Anaeromyces robustus]|eukprot:ORX78586.1 hypothetical protein BCR32DRAFT_270006 [Anaeromyces robustus]
MGTIDFIKNYDSKSNWDIYQDFFTFITTHYSFRWTFLLFIITGKRNWRNPVMLIIIFHLVFREIGIIFGDIAKLLPNKYPNYNYRSNEAFFIDHGLSRVFYYTSEVIADWYLLLRTKAIVKSNRKIIWVYITCALYCLSKLIKNYVNFSYIPYPDGFDPARDKMLFFKRRVTYKKNKWICDVILLITSIIYDIVVILTLKKYVFTNYDKIIQENNKKETFFIEKFKTLTTYRIYWTLLLTVLCTPIVLLFCFNLIYALNNVENFKDEKSATTFYENYCNDSAIEDFRVDVTHTGYILIKNSDIRIHYENNNKYTYKYNNDKINYYDLMNKNINNENISVNYYNNYNNNNNSNTELKKYYNSISRNI